jgi:glucan phosphoethanolaminetransferase (alkaline phosphatase superfamily)
MKFARTTPPPRINGKYGNAVSLTVAGLFVLMAVSQLYAFEDFVPLITSFGLGGGEARATIIASVLVAAEVLALPYLLRMHLSPLFRIFSMVLGWIVAVLWLFIAVSVYLSVNNVQDAGFLGTAITVPFGWWSVLYALALCILVAWVSRSMCHNSKKGSDHE